ncbi:hypothetical protein [Mordavella massiliensis]|uniref:Uncharacterized protein n=1 Tax=Mordavella massiliensis TaxID=1871024 RepID=A0A939BG65_9CLOT|nr:hypothetical protein [Mordavella massiliensis]MBM6947725.1 hypothetical protein [Mordavella massiliensis]
MKITGTKSYIQIEEENGNIARFDGEACLGEFYAYASSIRWVRHRGEATDGDRIDLIYRATRYGKETDTRVLFFDVDGSVMFETELRLKTEVNFFKGQLLFPVVVVLSLFFSALLIAALDVVSPGFYLAFCVGSLMFASPFLIWMLRICRFRLMAEGCDVTFTPVFGRRDRFPVSAITRVVRRTRRDCGCEEVKKIRIYTDSRRITITREMEGIDDMDAYLLRHVDAEKIITRRR